ncbi:hypothetical protein B4135_0564 [Caldibacillus debilis]|uniref:Uncharacterized protein n=1 Tax=Caldibacillus debilis TaxID=301148 RepID=A0A150MAJ4_9BACI|nr:hypothetical protein B4135_0564 [Caldibacillus debilis]
MTLSVDVRSIHASEKTAIPILLTVFSLSYQKMIRMGERKDFRLVYQTGRGKKKGKSFSPVPKICYNF